MILIYPVDGYYTFTPFFYREQFISPDNKSNTRCPTYYTLSILIKLIQF